MCILKASPPSYQRGAFLQGHRKPLLGPPLLPPGRGLPGSSADLEASELAQPPGKGAGCGWAPGEGQLPQNLLEDSPEASLKLLAKFGWRLGFSKLSLAEAGPASWTLGPRGRDKMGRKSKRKCGFY